jgi:hypothetical protein
MTNESANTRDRGTFETCEDTESTPGLQSSPIGLLPNQDSATGGSTEPSLVARMARSDVDGAVPDHVIDPFTSVGDSPSRPAATSRWTEFGQLLERGRVDVDDSQAQVVRGSPGG